MNIFQLNDIVESYDKIAIQTRQITVKELNGDKIEYLEYGLLKLTINSNEDVFIHLDDIKAIYGKNRRKKE